SARWAPRWDERTIINGGLTDQGDAFVQDNPVAQSIDQALTGVPGAGVIDLAKSAAAASNIIPGWSQHGGGGDGRVDTSTSEAPNLYLEVGKLTGGTKATGSRTHNHVYVPSASLSTGLFLVFDRQVANTPANGEVLPANDEVLR